MSLRRRAIVGLLVVVGLGLLGLQLQEHASMDVLVAREVQLRAWIAANALTAWCIGLGVYFLSALVPGTGGKSIVFGWLYGLWSAVVMVDVALTGAAIVTFLASRYVLRDVIESRFALHLVRLNEHFERHGGFYLLQLRLAHAPYTVVNYASGVLRVPTLTFWWTTQLGLLPGTMVFVFAGTRIPTLEVIRETGPLALLDPWLAAALIVPAVLPVLIRWCRRRINLARHTACGSRKEELA